MNPKKIFYEGKEIEVMNGIDITPKAADIKNLTIDDIQIRRADLSKECVEITGYYPGNFEPKALDEMLKEPNAGEKIDLMKDIIKRYMDKYKEDFELCMICDMAIEYLKIKGKETGNV